MPRRARPGWFSGQTSYFFQRAFRLETVGNNSGEFLSKTWWWHGETLSFVPRFRYNALVETLVEIQTRLAAAVSGARVEIIRNDAPSAQHSLLVDAAHAVATAKFLRDDPQLCLDYC